MKTREILAEYDAANARLRAATAEITLDPSEAERRLEMHYEAVAWLFNYITAADYERAVRDWDENYRTFQFDRERTERICGPRPRPPASWTADDLKVGAGTWPATWRDGGSGPALVDEIHMPVAPPVASVQLPEIGPRVEGFALNGVPTEAYYAPRADLTEGTTTEINGEPFVLTIVRGPVGFWRLWIKR